MNMLTCVRCFSGFDPCPRVCENCGGDTFRSMSTAEAQAGYEAMKSAAKIAEGIVGGLVAAQRERDARDTATGLAVGDAPLFELATRAGFRLESWMTNPPRPAMWHGTPEAMKELVLLVHECSQDGEKWRLLVP